MDLDWCELDPLTKLRDAIAATPAAARAGHLVDLARLHVDCRGRPTEWSLEDWSATVIELLDVATLVERMTFADTVSDVGRLPIALLCALLVDDKLVSRPLAERSRLDDDELLALIARDPSERMLLFVARRPGIGEALTDRVVELGSAKVHFTLACNGAARLTFESFDRFSRMARAQDVMDRALAGRDDLPCEIAKALHRRLSERAALRVSEMIARDLMRKRRPLVL